MNYYFYVLNRHITATTTTPNPFEADCGLRMVMTGTASVSFMVTIALFGAQALRLVVGDRGLSPSEMTVPSLSGNVSMI